MCSVQLKKNESVPTNKSFGNVVLEQMIKIFSANQKQELSMAVMFLDGSRKNDKFCKEPHKHHFCEVSVQKEEIY